MRKRSRIKLLGEIINQKFKGASAIPPVDGFAKIQNRLSVDAKLKTIVSGKLINGYEAPPIHAFAQIQQAIGAQPTVFQRYKVRAIATLLIIFLVSLLFIPTDYSRVDKGTYLSTTYKAPIDALQPNENQSALPDVETTKVDVNIIEDQPLEETLNLQLNSPVLDQVLNSNTNLVSPGTEGSKDLSLVVSGDLTDTENLEYEMKSPLLDVTGSTFESAQLKDYVLQDFALESNLVFPDANDSIITYFRKPNVYNFFFEFQAFANQTTIRTNAENWLTLTGNQGDLKQSLDFKVGGGISFPILKNIRMKTGVHYIRYSKNIEYLLYKNIPGSSLKFPSFYYLVGSRRENIVLNSLVGNLGIEVPVYRNHYIGIEYDLGKSLGSKSGNISNVGVYFGLAQFNFEGFTFILESHFNRSLNFNEAESFSFQNHTAGISLKIKK